MAKKSGGKSGTQRKAAKAPAKKSAAAKKTRAPRTNLSATAPRRLKPATYKRFHFQKRIKHPVKLPNVWRLARTATRTLWQHKKLFIGITIIYGLLNLVLVRGLAGNTDIGSVKSQFDQIFHGHFGSLASSFGVFVVLVGSAGNGSSPTAGAYQFILAFIVSLAVIWALRQVMAGNRLRIRDAYYRGMYPLIPFILVLLVISLQLIPLLLGGALYATVVTNGIAIGLAEKLVFLLIFILLGLLSLYLISSSLFALYIVTLPDMTPLQALRSARKVVRHRRWTVLRKIICLPIILLLVAAVIMLPIIIWLTSLAQWVFFVLTMFALVAAHSYMYTLYRELLNE